MTYGLCEASEADIEAIVSLVNRAFSVEKFFKTGERTDSLQIREMMSRGTFLLLSDDGGLAGCVFAQPHPQPRMRGEGDGAEEKQSDGPAKPPSEGNSPSHSNRESHETKRGYIGLLSVDPAQQKSGLGRRLMSAAEDFCRDAGCSEVDIVLVNVRPELAIIYGKMGYAQTGTESAAVIKTANRPVHFIRMSKKL